MLKSSEAIGYLSQSLDDPNVKNVWNEYESIQEIENVLRYPSIATREIEKATLTLSDLYGEIQKVLFRLEQFMKKTIPKTNLAAALLESIHERKKKLLNNPLMIAAVFLDPRYSFDLTPAETQIATYSLEKWHKTWKETVARSVSVQNTDDDSFELHLKAKKRCLSTSHSEYTNSNSLLAEIDKYQKNMPDLDHRTNIVQYWEGCKDEYPELFQLSRIIHTVAPTQVSVERAFSILGYIFNDRRVLLKPRMLENLLIINLNKDMVPSINTRELKEIDDTQCESE